MAPSAPEPRTAPSAGPALAAAADTAAPATPTATVTVRYWAAARAAAGTDSETPSSACVVPKALARSSTTIASATTHLLGPLHTS